MTVSELIEFLKTQDQELQVIYECCSESVLLEQKDIFEVNACEARPDGWVQNKRPDVPVKKYLSFPGN